MMKTEVRLALSLRQRRFEWALARDEHARTAARLAAGKTHDLLNLIQIIRLASRALEAHCDERGREIALDLQRTATDSHRSLSELMALAHPAETVVKGPPVVASVEAAVASLKHAIAFELQISAPPAAATHCNAEELEHVVIGLALDAAAAPGVERVELAVRAREVAGSSRIEIVRGGEVFPGGDRFELRAVGAIAHRAGGELTLSGRRGGGEEVIVALPEVA